VLTQYRDPEKLEKITNSLSIQLPPHITRSKDPRAILTTVFASWLPLSTALLVSVIEHLPSPRTSQAERLPQILDASPGAEHIDSKLRRAMVEFDANDNEPIVAYVSKMVAIKESELPEHKRRGGAMTAEEAREMGQRKRAEIAKAQALASNDPTESVTEALDGTTLSETGPEDEETTDPEHLIGFARIYSGTIKVGDEVFVIPPKFSPAHPHVSPEPKKATVTALYLLMGRSLEPLQSAPAGVVFGIAGLEGLVLKSATICSQLEGSVNLAGVSMASQPIVRVALEPVNPSDLGKMVAGCKLLEQSDPCAEYEVLESGEHVISTAGELHLERCLKDLRERFARCEIQAGEPIVPYRESIVSAPEMAAPKEKELPRGTVIGITTSKQVTIRLRVRPLPSSVTEFLGKNTGAIKRLYSERKAEEESRRHGGETPEEAFERDSAQDNSGTDMGLSLQEFKAQLKLAFAEVKAEREVWAGAVEAIAAFGPRRVGPNVLIDSTRQGTCRRFLRETGHGEHSEGMNGSETPKATSDGLRTRDFSDKIAHAFQLATGQGPLCNEPVQGVAVFLEDIMLSLPVEEETSGRDSLGRLTGEVIKTVRDSIRQGFLDWSPRLLLAMYSCEIQASSTQSTSCKRFMVC
jgi:ribosome assembly protein 1